MKWIILMMAAIHLGEPDPGLWYCTCSPKWLTGTLNGAIVNINGDTHAFSAFTSPQYLP